MQQIVSLVKNVVMFLLVATMLINLFSDSEYKKYIRYAVGIIVMIMVLSPVWKIIHEGVTLRAPGQDLSVEEQVRLQEERMRLLEEHMEDEMFKKGGEEHGEQTGN